MSTASSESEDVDLQRKQKVRKSVRQRSQQPRDSDCEEETITDKLNDLLSSDGDSNGAASEPEDCELADDDVIELDENGCVEDFNIIADALEQRKFENKTFNDLELRDIERKNSILMNKILSHNKRPSQYKIAPLLSKTSNSSVNRKKQQMKIDQDNLRLLKKIQSVKPFGLSHPKK